MNQEGNYLVVIEDQLKEKEKYYSGIAKLCSLNENKIEEKQIQLVLEKSEISSCPLLGDSISIKAFLNPISKNLNPYVFDFSSYMASKGVYESMYVKNGNWFVLDKDSSTTPRYFFKNTNANSSQMLETYSGHNESVSIIKTILLGNRTSLQKETIALFSNTGTSHILAVSGMHVGMLLLCLSYIFKLFPLTSVIFKVLKDVFILACLWFYVFLVGSGPAVLRAGMMFSLFYLGSVLNKNGNHLNILFFSAFIQAFLDPSIINSLSYIFSYTAMLSILFFYKPIFSLLKFKNTILKYFWTLITISLAANMLMLPVVVYYFHKLPLFFVLSGLIATPIAFAILFLGIIFFISLIFPPFITEIVSFLLIHLADLLLILLKFINKTPFSIIDSIFIPKAGLFLILGCIIFGGIAFIHNKKNFLYGAVFLFLTSILYLGMNKTQQYNDTEFWVYQDRKKTYIDIFYGYEVLSWIEEGQEPISEFVNKGLHMAKYRKVFNKVVSGDEFKNEEFHIKNQTFYSQNSLCHIIRKENDFEKISIGFDDIVIFDIKTASMNFNLLKNLKAKTFVISARVRPKQIERITSLLHPDIEVWDISKKGPFVLKL